MAGSSQHQQPQTHHHHVIQVQHVQQQGASSSHPPRSPVSTSNSASANIPDMEFISTRYGLLRISQAVISFLALILVESTGSCWGHSYHNHNFFASISSFAMVFAIIVMIFFCFRVQDVIDRYINLPLTLCVTEAVCCVFYAVASILLIVSYCPRSGLNFLSKIAAVSSTDQRALSSSSPKKMARRKCKCKVCNKRTSDTFYSSHLTLFPATRVAS